MEQIPTKKCPSCYADVPLKATRCSHCQADFRNWINRHPFLTFIALIIFVPVMIGSTLSDLAGSSSTATTKPDYEGSAITYAEPYIARLLKAPSTADFCRGTATPLGQNKYRVSSCVDSQNSYGANLRSNWEAVMVYTGGNPDDISSWEPEKITFDGKVVYQE